MISQHRGQFHQYLAKSFFIQKTRELRALSLRELDRKVAHKMLVILTTGRSDICSGMSESSHYTRYVLVSQ